MLSRIDHVTISVFLLVGFFCADPVRAVGVEVPAVTVTWEVQTKRFLTGLCSKFRSHYPELEYVNGTIGLLELPEMAPHDRCDFSAITKSNVPDTDQTVDSIVTRYAYDAILAERSREYQLGQHVGAAIDQLFRSLIELEVRLRQHELRQLAVKGLAFDDVVVALFLRHSLAEGVRKAVLFLERRDPRFDVLLDIYSTPVKMP